MNSPRDFLKRAENARRQADAGQASRPARPAPMQISIKPAEDGINPPPAMPNGSVPEREPAPVPPEYRIAPQPMGGHGIYRELMRSHDRMGTRHIPRKD